MQNRIKLTEEENNTNSYNNRTTLIVKRTELIVKKNRPTPTV